MASRACVKIYRRCAFGPLTRFDTGQRSRYLSARASDARLLRLGYWAAHAASDGPLPAGSGHRQDTVFRLRRAKAARASARAEADALIISGSETDVCVLATVLSAVDLGYGRHLPSPRHPDAARSCYEGTNGTRGARAGDASAFKEPGRRSSHPRRRSREPKERYRRQTAKLQPFAAGRP